MRQVARHFADGAEAQRVRELGLPLSDLFLRLLAGFACAQRLPGMLALGDVLDGEQDQNGAIAAVGGACDEQHDARAQGFEIVLDFEVVEHILPRQDCREQRSQLGDIPPVVSELEERLADR